MNFKIGDNFIDPIFANVLQHMNESCQSNADEHEDAILQAQVNYFKLIP